jgi:hypothetical protein
LNGERPPRCDFATKALDNYQSIVATLVAERAGAELGTRGRLPRSFTSKLFIRDMLRGSVGFLLQEPASAQLEFLQTALKEAVNEATDILQDLSGTEMRSFETRMSQLTPRTIGAVKNMVKVLHDAGAETTIVGDARES